MDEKDLIPYTTSELPAGPWLVFAPHPDDETFGMGGSLLLAQQCGIDVDIVFLTDGGKAPNSDIENIVDVREAEARSVCETLGVRDHHFLRESDRQLTSSESVRKRVAELIRECVPEHIFIPSCLEFHPDHRAAAEIIWESVQTMSDNMAQLVSYDITNLGPCNYLIDISSVVESKRKVMDLYVSQVGSQRYVDLVESLDTARTFSLEDSCIAAEGFYRFARLPNMTYQQVNTHWFAKFSHRRDQPQERVSVVVRTKNRPALLREALTSLELQYHRNLEVIVVNDGGSSPAPVLQKFNDTFSNLIIVENKACLGRAAAANQGLDLVTGDFFMFLDDDDWFDPEHISNLLEKFQQDKNLIVAYTGVRVVDFRSTDTESSNVFNEPFDRNRLFYENYIPIHAVLTRRSVLDNGHRMDESFEVFEDWDFWLQLCQLTPQFGHVDAVTANYRIGEEHGIGVKGGYAEVRRRLYARWARTWGIDEIDDLLTRLVLLSKG